MKRSTKERAAAPAAPAPLSLIEEFGSGTQQWGELRVTVGYGVQVQVVGDRRMVIDSKDIGVPVGPGDRIELVLSLSDRLNVLVRGEVVRAMSDASGSWLVDIEHVEKSQRRQFVRASVQGALATVHSDEGEVQARLADISASGLAVVTGASLRMGERVRVETTLPGETETQIEAEAEVTRCNPTGSGSQSARIYGLRMVDLDPTTEDKIMKWVLTSRRRDDIGCA